MSAKEMAEIEKTEAETDQIHIDSGVLSPIEVRTQVAQNPDSRYPGLDVEDVPDLGAEEAGGLEPRGQSGSNTVDALFPALHGA